MKTLPAIIAWVLGLLAFLPVQPLADQGTVIEGSMQRSKLALYDEENKKFFLQKRYLFEQQFRPLQNSGDLP